ncbi:MAG: malonyl-ACP O-methyltransferase BioC [Proteobacteria bacterium]|nr:malonyl-ACP O-methyltransferase BioC [Pseudomonadota bacterium]
MNANPVKKADIARSFSLAATTYDAAAFVQKEIGHRLLERLDLIKHAPCTILDVGAGTGYITRLLQQKFPKSQILGLDLAQGMTHFAKSKQPWHLWKNKPFYICGDTESLPFANASFDLIFSNLTLQWCFSLNHVFAEFQRVLKPNGMLFFSTLGPQTLFELRLAFKAVNPTTHVNDFLDMHDIGDLMLNAYFSDPVVDMEMIKATYPSVKQLLVDLKATGARNMNETRVKSLTTKHLFKSMIQAYEQHKQLDGFYPATYEVIYGHACQQERQHYPQDSDGYVRIPAKIPVLKKQTAL